MLTDFQNSFTVKTRQ